MGPAGGDWTIDLISRATGRPKNKAETLAIPSDEKGIAIAIKPGIRACERRLNLCAKTSLFAQAGNSGVGVVCEADAVDAVRGFQLAGVDQRRFFIRGNDRTVYGAIDFVVFDRHCNFLRNRLAWDRRFMHGVVCFASAVHLKRLRTKSAHDEAAVAIGCAIEITLLRCTQVVAGDEDSVRMR